MADDDGAQNANKANNKVADSAKGAAAAVAKMTATLGLTKPGLTDLANTLPGVASKLGAMTKVLEGQVKDYQTLTKSGISFGGSLTTMLTSSTAAGLSIKEMTGLVASNSELLAGFGDTVEGGNEKFLKNLAHINRAGNTYGVQLRNIGLTHEEIGEAMMQTQRMAMMAGYKEQLTQDQLAMKTAEYAKDLDLLTKLTGKSADALKKEQAALQRQGDFRAKTMGMEVDMQKAMLNAASEADAAGIGDLFKDMMIRGFPSKDQAQLAGMFGNSMQVMQQMKAAQDAGNTAEYNRLKGTLQAAVIKDKMAKNELAMLGGTTKATGALSESLSKTSESMIGIQSMAMRENMSMDEIQKLIEERRKKAAQQQKDQGGEAQPGDAVDPNRAVLDAALRGQEAMIRAATEVQAQVTEKVYNEFLGPIFQKITQGLDVDAFVTNTAGSLMTNVTGAFDETFGNTAGPTQQQTDDASKRISAAMVSTSFDDATKEALSQLQTEITSLSTITDRSKEETKKLTDAVNKANQLTNAGVPVISATPPNNNKVVKPGAGVGSESNLPVPRNTGTPGMQEAMKGFTSFAGITENFGKGTLAMLHGNELVMTEAQAKQLDEGIAMLKANAPTLGGTDGLRNAATSIQGAVNTMRSTPPTANLSGMTESMAPMMEEMKTTMAAQAEAMKSALPPDMMEKMATAMEKTASGIGSQLIEQKNMTKATKNLKSMGNVFGRGGLGI